MSEQFQNLIEKTKNTTLSKQFQNLIEKNKNTTLSKQFQNPMKKQIYNSVGTVPKSNSKIVGRGKWTPLAHKYMKLHFRGLVHVHQ